MPIPFECSCGKKMSAKEEFAGRRLRCPECQRVVTIPKPASGRMPRPANPARRPSSRLLVQPSLTASDAAALDVTRPTPPEPKRPDFDSPENLAALFNTLSSTPVLAAPPGPAPPCDDELVATQIGQNTEPFAPTENFWIDRSLQQTATPWRSGDERRFQAGVAPAREWDWPLEWMAPLFVLATTLVFAAGH